MYYGNFAFICCYNAVALFERLVNVIVCMCG